MEINRRTIVTIDNQDITSQITSGTIKLTEMMLDGELQFGQVCVDMFECQIYGLNSDVVGSPIFVNVIEDGELYKLKANNDYLIDHDRNNYAVSTTPSKRMFTGVIDKCTKDYTNTYRDIIAYSFTRLDEDITDWWNGYWAIQGTTQATSTVKEFRQALIEHMGLIEIDKTLPNESLEITATPVSDSSVTFRYALTCIGEIQRCFPHINRDGVVEYITLGTTAKTLTDLYEKNNTEWEDKQVEKITGVAVYSTSDNALQSVGTSDNAYMIVGNIFVLNMETSALNTFLTDYFNAIKNIQYTPCTLSLIVSDLDYKLGDKITYNGITSYIFQNAYSGVQYVNEVITCKSNILRSKDVKTINNTVMESRRYSKVNQTIEGITTEVGELTTDLHTNYSTTQQTATMISTEVASVKVGGVNMIKESNTYNYSQYTFI